jgi:hypothetical protein
VRRQKFRNMGMACFDYTIIYDDPVCIMNVLFKKSGNNYVYDMQLLFFRSWKLTIVNSRSFNFGKPPVRSKNPNCHFAKNIFFLLNAHRYP